MSELIVMRILCIIMGIIAGACLGFASVYRERNKINTDIIRELSNELDEYKKHKEL